MIYAFGRLFQMTRCEVASILPFSIPLPEFGGLPDSDMEASNSSNTAH